MTLTFQIIMFSCRHWGGKPCQAHPACKHTERQQHHLQPAEPGLQHYSWGTSLTAVCLHP